MDTYGRYIELVNGVITNLQLGRNHIVVILCYSLYGLNIVGGV